MSSRFTSRIALFALVCLAQPALAAPAEYTEPSLFHCETAPESTAALDQCAQTNLTAAIEKKTVMPVYTSAATSYFYTALTDLNARGVLKPGKDWAMDDLLLRRHLGEWLYFTQAGYISDGQVPDDYNGVDLIAMAKPIIFPQSNDFLVFYWDYNGASNSVYQAVRLSASGLTPIAAESYDEVSKKLSTAPIGAYNNFRFDPAQHTLVDSAHDSANSGAVTHYKLEGDIFRLKRLEYVTLTGDDGKTKTTLVYKAK